MKRILAQWWNNWARIDIVVLGLALLSTIAYLNYRYIYSTNNEPWVELWSSITTDLFFAWITIRVIDALIGRRDHREEVRRTLAGNLNYTIEILQSFLPQIYQHDLSRLKYELSWANRRFPNRKFSLDRNGKEAQRLKDAYAALDVLTKDADDLITVRHDQINCQRNIQRKLKELEKLRNKFNSDSHKLHKEIIAEPLQDKILQIRELLRSNMMIISDNELSHFEHQLAELEKQVNVASKDRLSFEWLHINTIFANDIGLDDEVRYILDDLQEISNQDYELLLQRLQVCKASVKSISLPNILLDTLQKHHNVIETMINAYKKIDHSCKEAIKALNTARDDILEETTFD